MRTYLDTGVLLAAFRGEPDLSARALEVLDDPERSLIVSDAVRLETLPKAHYHREMDEVQFLQEIFSVAENVSWNCDVLENAFELAKDHGIAAMDAIHVANAMAAGADELVTSEGDTKPMFRVQSIRVVSLRSDAVR